MIVDLIEEIVAGAERIGQVNNLVKEVLCQDQDVRNLIEYRLAASGLVSQKPDTSQPASRAPDRAEQMNFDNQPPSLTPGREMNNEDVIVGTGGAMSP